MLHGDPSEAAELPARKGISAEERALGQQFRERYANDVEDVIVRSRVESPRVTLVVVSYKAGDYLLSCLRHLRGQTVRGEVPYEILLADSGGLEPLRARYGNLVDVDLRLRSGLPLNVARNAAMAWARGELVAIIDDDGLVDPDWLEEGLDLFADPSVGVARGRILPHEHPYFNAYVVHYDRGDAIWDDESLGTEGNMLVRRRVYLEIGGFPDEFYGAEGSYLVYKLKRKFPELRAVYAPRMVMRHDYCRSAREFVWKAKRYRTTRRDATADDPEFAAFMAAFMRKDKPKQEQPLDERVARRLLRAAKWTLERMPGLDRIKRR